MRPAAKHALAFLAALAVGGCAYFSPDQVREAKRRHDIASPNPPFTAISCAARRAEEHQQGVTANIREAAQRGAYEAPVGALGTVVIVLEASPAAAGSTLTVWINPIMRDDIAAQYVAAMKGC